jgi:hypothetical protein
MALFFEVVDCGEGGTLESERVIVLKESVD